MAKRNASPLERSFAGLIVIASVVLALATAKSQVASNRTVMEKAPLAGANVPVQVRAILQRACQDCHSENTIWPWYAHIPPVSWQIHRDVAKGRASMDLSKWSDYTDGERRGFKVAIGAVIESHLMPPPQYVWIHREAWLSGNELELVKAWTRAKSKPEQQ